MGIVYYYRAQIYDAATCCSRWINCFITYYWRQWYHLIVGTSMLYFLVIAAGVLNIIHHGAQSNDQVKRGIQYLLPTRQWSLRTMDVKKLEIYNALFLLPELPRNATNQHCVGFSGKLTGRRMVETANQCIFYARRESSLWRHRLTISNWCRHIYPGIHWKKIITWTKEE